MAETQTGDQKALRDIIIKFGLGDYRYVGKGKEGFVFSDRSHRYKVFVNGKTQLGKQQTDFLINRLGGDNPPRRILPVSEVVEVDEDIITVSPSISGELYKGGRWRELVELLRECRDRGIALMNIHPDNIIVVDGKIMYVDVGSSIRELNDSLWKQMVRRAFLSFKLADSEKLKEKMTQALIEDIPELDGIDILLHDIEHATDHYQVHSESENREYLQNVTLLIRTCHMEWATIEFQVKHIVSQLESRYRFFEKVVICGSNTGPFARQYQSPNVEAEIESLEKLQKENVIDRYLIAPSDPEIMKSISKRWFNLETTNPYSAEGEPTLDSLFGFDQCRTGLILQMDSDMIIGVDEESEYLKDLVDVILTHPYAVGVSIPPPLQISQPYSPTGLQGKWRTEVRLSLLNKERLEELLPLPNTLTRGQLAKSWYRSLDTRLKETDYAFYRGGMPGTFNIHVPNLRKTDQNEWYNIVKAVERGNIWHEQTENIDLVGSLGDWIVKRGEDLVFVVRGKDTPLTKLHRCLESLKAQKNQSFGVLFIDAGSTNGSVEMLENFCKREMKGRTTLLLNWKSLTAVENMVIGIREAINSRDSIVALLDADDALLSEYATDIIVNEYLSGADLTVGSMLRTDERKYYPVEFRGARKNRGGNVWQHIRTFKKYLFDRIEEEDLKMDGEWIPYAEDWAFMLPMVEMAKKPVWIKESLYLYDPDAEKHKFTKSEREKMIARISQKKSYLDKVT